MKKVVKSGGHCYDSMGIGTCDFWIEENVKEHISNSAKAANRPKTCIVKHYCALFGRTEKYLSKALRCCDKTYGDDYDGEA